MLEMFCVWQLEENSEKFNCFEKYMKSDTFDCPYKISDVKKEKGCFCIPECKDFIPLDNLRDYFKNKKD